VGKGKPIELVPKKMNFFFTKFLEKDGERGYKRGTKNMKLRSNSRAFENFYK